MCGAALVPQAEPSPLCLGVCVCIKCPGDKDDVSVKALASLGSLEVGIVAVKGQLGHQAPSILFVLLQRHDYQCCICALQSTDIRSTHQAGSSAEEIVVPRQVFDDVEMDASDLGAHLLGNGNVRRSGRHVSVRVVYDDGLALLQVILDSLLALCRRLELVLVDPGIPVGLKMPTKVARLARSRWTNKNDNIWLGLV